VGGAPSPPSTHVEVIDIWGPRGQIFVAAVSREPVTNRILVQVTEFGGGTETDTADSDDFASVWAMVLTLTARFNGAVPDCSPSDMENNYAKWVQENPPVVGGGETPLPPEELPDLNLSQLLPPPSRVRVAMWRE